jgi:hypothetical protein
MSAHDIINSEAFKKCEVFHGHICPGLAIGYRAATAAMAWLHEKRSASFQAQLSDLGYAAGRSFHHQGDNHETARQSECRALNHLYGMRRTRDADQNGKGRRTASVQGMHKTNRALKTIEVPQLLDLSVSVYPAGNVVHDCCSDIAGLLIFSPRTPCVYFHKKMVEHRIEFERHIFLV